MYKILDIHTHHTAPQPEALICVFTDSFRPVEGQLYSMGIHPWDTTDDIPESLWEAFEKACADPRVKAIGECGIDLFKGGPLYKQMLVMKRQVEISERIGKPLIIHDVRAHDVIIGMRKDLKPSCKWMIHGFRGKPAVADMFIRAGFMLSFGAKFNRDTVASVPEDSILAETDGSDMSITEVIASLSAVRGEDLSDIIAGNSNRFLGLTQAGTTN